MGIIDVGRAVQGSSLDSVLGCMVPPREEHGLLYSSTGVGLGVYFGILG